MKKFLAVCLLIVATLFPACAKEKGYVLNEQTFFLVMTNIQYYPEQYVGADIEYDCFTYELTDVNGNAYMCGVRKCSAGYGCNCGNDTIIGFLLEYDGEIPAPRNQSEDNNDKTWIHLKGQLSSAEKTQIEIHSYVDGEIDPSATETITFLSFRVETLELIEEYSNLQYYVTK